MGAAAVRPRQPVLIAYIAVGILAGPAGVSLASTSYREAIGAHLTGIHDFLLLFFIDQGARLDFSTLGGLTVAQISEFSIVSWASAWATWMARPWDSPPWWASSPSPFPPT